MIIYKIANAKKSNNIIWLSELISRDTNILPCLREAAKKVIFFKVRIIMITL